jgi:hypothetical protein
MCISILIKNIFYHRLDIELDLLSLIGLLCTELEFFKSLWGLGTGEE